MMVKGSGVSCSRKSPPRGMTTTLRGRSRRGGGGGSGRSYSLLSYYLFLFVVVLLLLDLVDFLHSKNSNWLSPLSLSSSTTPSTSLYSYCFKNIFVQAHSSRPDPLREKALAHPSNIHIRIIPKTYQKFEGDQQKRQETVPSINLNREPQWNDKFILRFNAHRKEEDSTEENKRRREGGSVEDDDRTQGHTERITLSLRPSTTLIPSEGIQTVVTHTDPTTGERQTETTWLRREEVRAYEGWVVNFQDEEEEEEEQDDNGHWSSSSSSSSWYREEVAGLVRNKNPAENWARIVLLPQVVESVNHEDDGEGQRVGNETPIPLFQGSFSIGNSIYTIHSTSNYLRTKEWLDPDPPLKRKHQNAILESHQSRKRQLMGKPGQGGHPEMVIVRERDTMSPFERLNELRRRGMPIHEPPAITKSHMNDSNEAPVNCGHDNLAYNMDPSHPVFAQQAFTPSTYLNARSDGGSSVTFLSETAFPVGWINSHVLRRSQDDQRMRNIKTRFQSLTSNTSFRKRQSGGDISGGSGQSSNFINSIGSTSGCPKTPMVLFVGVAADCSYTANYGSADKARTQILTDFNSASSLYQQTFNVSLGIVELSVQSGPCPTTAANVDPSFPWNVACEGQGSTGVDLNTRLSIFSEWRGNKVDRAGLWHLMTDCASGSEVGVAWLGTLCRVSSSNGTDGQSTSGTGVTSITRNEWQVVAHEIGHNFGAIHDCASGCTLSNSNPVCCPLSTTTCDANSAFLMSPVSSDAAVSTFSPCSIGNICYSIGNSLNTSCLAVPGASGSPKLISLQSCGNGILEEGEDCDPGSSSNSTCCDKATCKFIAGAVCDPLNSLCCTPQCQVASAGTICREAEDVSCDIAEVCSGTNSTCPPDDYRSDGTSCGSNGLACASGVCTSRTQQCVNAGSSLGITKACPQIASSSCSITCQDPSSASSCLILDQSFRDGTPCGFGGTCENGGCQAGSTLAAVGSWFRQNLQISIPVTVVASLIALVILVGIFRCCTGRNHTKTGYRNGKPPPSSQFQPQPLPPYAYAVGSGTYPPVQMQIQQPPPVTYNGAPNMLYRNTGSEHQPSYPPPPPAPPPMYGPGSRVRGDAPAGWVDPSEWNGPMNRS